MKTQNNNGTTAAKVNERAHQYDEVTKVIRISFEHDGRMSAEEAREYVAARAIGYADHTGTIDEGTRIMDVEDMGEPEPERRPHLCGNSPRRGGKPLQQRRQQRRDGKSHRKGYQPRRG